MCGQSIIFWPKLILFVSRYRARLNSNQRGEFKHCQSAALTRKCKSRGIKQNICHHARRLISTSISEGKVEGIILSAESLGTGFRRMRSSIDWDALYHLLTQVVIVHSEFHSSPNEREKSTLPNGFSGEQAAQVLDCLVAPEVTPVAVDRLSPHPLYSALWKILS